MERYINPVPPERVEVEDDFAWQKSGSKTSGAGGLPEVRKAIGSTQKFVASTYQSNKQYTDRDMKGLADRLGFTLNSKVNNSFDMFKFFDKDNDG